MLDLPTLILNLRPDLRELFPPKDPQQRKPYFGWLLQSGVQEYKSLHEDRGFANSLAEPHHGPDGCLTLLQHLVWLARPDLQDAFPLPGTVEDFKRWFYTHGVEEHPLWHYLSDDERCLVLAHPTDWAARLEPVISGQQQARRARALPLNKRKFGVNVIGYAFGQLGIGEDARMAARALRAARVPMTLLNFPPGSDIPQNDRSMARHVSESAEYAVNLFCLTAEETGRFYLERGGAQFAGRYNIGYWPWELGKWPKQWEMILDLVDEVWVSTQHTYSALAPVCRKPLYVMPMAVDLGPVRKFSSRVQARKHFGLPPRAKLFCFAFDLKSWTTRKNPEACIAAFLKAFPRKRAAGSAAPEVGLVVKTHRPAGKNAAWEKLKALAARDPRIHIIESTLPRPDLLALYQACDCFLSLHRAEGFGRGFAEAMQLGLHVICTGYSGNVDFCQPPHADLVRYRLVKLKKNDYVHATGQVWAEPDVAHAAQLMREFVQRDKDKRKPAFPQFSPAAVGKRYKQRLDEIRAQFGLGAGKEKA